MASIDVETFNGWRITLSTEDGRFTATLEGSAGGYARRGGLQAISRKDLAAVKREIAARTKGRIEVMNASALTIETRTDYSHREPYEVLPKIPNDLRAKLTTTIVSVTAENKLRDETGQILQDYNGYVLADQSIIARMNEFVERKRAMDEALNQEYGEWVRTLGLHKLTADEIKKLLVESSTTIGSILDGAIGGDEQS